MTPDLRIERVIPGTKKDLFEAWLDPKALSRFMTPAEGMSCGNVEVDARVGGKFLIVMITAGKEMPHHGEYLEIERYERLAFTWISHHAGDGSHHRGARARRDVLSPPALRGRRRAWLPPGPTSRSRDRARAHRRQTWSSTCRRRSSRYR